MTFGTAVVIGKFYPPHPGHKLVIDTALQQARYVTVIVCAKESDSIPGELRRRWLEEIHPEARVLLIDDSQDENDPAVWASNTIRWLGSPPDAVFSSEDYGEPYARAMGSRSVIVDRDRRIVPCSGTAVRQNPFAWWDFLDAPVRAWFALRVCVVGAESTGTTTLAERLALHYDTVWVPEYGREYSERKLAAQETEWTSEEFVHIAREQIEREDRAARIANRVLICDTNAFATELWHRRHVGGEHDAVRAVALQARCDLYVLTGDEIPFVQDGLRDGEHIRHEMHRWFEEALSAQAVPWLLVRGPLESRVESAVRAIDRALSVRVSSEGRRP